MKYEPVIQSEILIANKIHTKEIIDPVSKIGVDLTVYCRKDGNDKNDGLADTPDRAFRTVQGAQERVIELYKNNWGCTIIQCTTDGEFSRSPNESLIISRNTNIYFPDGTLSVKGIKHTAIGYSGNYLSGKTINITGPASGAAIYMEQAFLAVSGNINLKSDVTYFFYCQQPFSYLYSADSSIIDGGNHTVSYLFDTIFYSYMLIKNKTFKNLNISKATAYVQAASMLDCRASTFTNVTSAKKFQLGSMAILATGGAGENYLPGTAAGTKASNGTSVIS